MGFQSHPKECGDFGQGSTENISECNNQLESSIILQCVLLFMILPNPHKKYM